MPAVRRMPFIPGRQRWACACPRKRASDTTKRKNVSFFMLLHFEFADFPCTHKVFVLNGERLMPAAVLLAKLHDKLLAVGDGKLRHGKDRTLTLAARHAGDVVLRPQRKHDLLLHGRALDYLLVHDFPSDVIHVEGDVALVPDFGVEVNQSAVRINTFQQVLYTETLAADVLDSSSILPVDGFHDEPHEHRALAAQFVKVHLLRIVRTVRTFTVVNDVCFAPILAALGIAGTNSSLPLLAKEVRSPPCIKCHIEMNAFYRGEL